MTTEGTITVIKINVAFDCPKCGTHYETRAGIKLGARDWFCVCPECYEELDLQVDGSLTAEVSKHQPEDIGTAKR